MALEISPTSEGKWVVFPDTGLKVDEIGSTVFAAEPLKDNMCHAMFVDRILGDKNRGPKSVAVWELKTSTGDDLSSGANFGGWVGLTTETGGFRKNWGLSGMFFGGPGNRSSGSSLSGQSCWGPPLASGDRVFMRVQNVTSTKDDGSRCDTTVMFCIVRKCADAKTKELKEQALEEQGFYTFDFSDPNSSYLRIPLGAAFHIKDWSAEVAQLMRPCVSLEKEGQSVEIVCHHDETASSYFDAAFFTRGEELLTEEEIDARWLKQKGGLDPAEIGGNWKGQWEGEWIADEMESIEGEVQGHDNPDGPMRGKVGFTITFTVQSMTGAKMKKPKGRKGFMAMMTRGKPGPALQGQDETGGETTSLNSNSVRISIHAKVGNSISCSMPGEKNVEGNACLVFKSEQSTGAMMTCMYPGASRSACESFISDTLLPGLVDGTRISPRELRLRYKSRNEDSTTATSATSALAEISLSRLSTSTGQKFEAVGKGNLDGCVAQDYIEEHWAKWEHRLLVGR